MARISKIPGSLGLTSLSGRLDVVRGARTVFGPAVPMGVSPDAFSFHTVITDDGKGPSGGWQETDCETVRFKSPMFFFLPPTVIDVRVRVGVPIRNQKQGVITPSRAQLESVEAANLAGLEVTAALNAGDIIPSQVEAMFIQLMNFHLLIDGRRVTTCTGGSKKGA